METNFIILVTKTLNWMSQLLNEQSGNKTISFLISYDYRLTNTRKFSV